MTVNINISDAAFRYGSRNIWQDLNLEINRGETLCLLGPNGCGKTTLLNCIHGDLSLYRGVIHLHNRPVTEMGASQIARKMGYVFQEHSAPFPYPVMEVVRMGRAPHLSLFQTPGQEDTRIAESMLDRIGLLHLRNKRYTEISGGERQLVLIARSLAQEPEIVLLDEPTSHLDFRNQALILRMIRKLADRGLTIIMSSHFPNHALTLSCRVALMTKKGFVDVGPALDVMTDENLSRTYGIDVRVLSVKDPYLEEEVFFCVPRLAEDRGLIKEPEVSNPPVQIRQQAGV